ncbi:DUF1016 N-terminal domain-containing protein [Rhodopirellula sallentina]|uniref:DUF1016 N-terminal domain-containing protein n=1 Tax=Rhodopirellula sallentina TaxID=1263869 RepID=UPI0005C7B111|nr:DUF1016 N-terminal domain-containing protein [Rhodopirellula sallentina]
MLYPLSYQARQRFALAGIQSATIAVSSVLSPNHPTHDPTRFRKDGSLCTLALLWSSQDKPARRAIPTNTAGDRVPNNLVSELSDLISEAHTGFVRTVNATMVSLYWQVGTRIRTDILQNKQVEYRKQICVTLSRQLIWSHFVTNLPSERRAET